MNIGAIILIALAIIIIVGSVGSSFVAKIPEFLFALPFGFILFIAGLSIQYPIPNDEDVKNGRAHYIEQNHIEVVNGDTINAYKTYEIVWNQNTK